MSNHQNTGQLLRSIGMHPKYKGYAYLQFIIDEVLKEPQLLYMLSTIVYPRLMQKFSASRVSVDRNVKFVILRTWETGDRYKLNRMFCVGGTERIPSNMEFISVIVSMISNDFDNDNSNDTKPHHFGTNPPI